MAKFTPRIPFLRKLNAPEAIEVLHHPKRKAATVVGYRLGTRITKTHQTSRGDDSERARLRRWLHAIESMERRLRAMKAVLPPQSGKRRAEFSSPVPGKWATSSGERTS